MPRTDFAVLAVLSQIASLWGLSIYATLLIQPNADNLAAEVASRCFNLFECYRSRL